MGMSLGFALGNYVFLIKALNELFHFTTATSSLIVYIGIFVILILIIEPEKIKPIAYLLSFFALSASKPKFIKIFNYSIFDRKS